MKIRLINAMFFSLVMIFISSSLTLASDEVSVEVLETEPSEQLIERIHTDYANASLVRVNYIPRHYLGTPFLSKEKILIGWVYQFSYRCVTGSCVQKRAQLKEYFSSGLKQNQECPGPYYSAVELLKKEDRVMVAYVDQTGNCFTLDGDSFFSPLNFEKFLVPEAL